MDNKLFVSDLVDGEPVRTVFLVADKRLGTTKTGNPFLTLELADKSGSVTGRVWDDAEAISTRFDHEDFVRVEAHAETYKGQIQLNVRDLQRVEPDEFDLANFIPASDFDRDAMLDQLKALVSREVKSAEMLRFLDTLFDQKQLIEQFKLAPAAKGNHHAYLGGLLEHTLSMTRLGAMLSRHYAHYYPGMLNQDLVIAGCIMHDIGKCFELSYGRSFDYTDEGRLVGHIVQGAELVTSIAQKVSPALPASMLTQLKHLILSHHGKKEFGSPVLPRTPEALLLHEIDMIDSRMAMCTEAVEEHRSGSDADKPWTGYQRLFQGNLWVGDEPSTKWARVNCPAEDELEGPGALPAGAATAAAPAKRSAKESRESEETLDLFSK